MAKEYRQRTDAMSSGPLGLGSGQAGSNPVPSALSHVGDALQQVGVEKQNQFLQESMTYVGASVARAQAFSADRIDELNNAPADQYDPVRQKWEKDWAGYRKELQDNVAKLPREAQVAMRATIDKLDFQNGKQITAISQQKSVDRAGMNAEQEIAASSQALQRDPSAFDDTVARSAFLIQHYGIPQEAQMKLMDTARRRYAGAAVEGLIARDAKSTLTELQNPDTASAPIRALNAQQRDAAVTAAQKAITDQSITSNVGAIMGAYQQSVTRGNAALSALPADMPDEVKLQVREKVRQQFALHQDESSRQYHDELVGIVQKIDLGQATSNDAARLTGIYEKGGLTEAQHLSYLTRYNEARKKAADAADGAQNIADMLRMGLPLDPQNSDHRKWLDGAFQQAVGVKPQGSDEWQATALGMAGQTRMLPTSAVAWTRQAMRSPDSALAARAAAFYGATEASVPDAVSGIDSPTKAFAGLVNSMVQAGTDPTKAAETARELVFNANQQVIDQRHKLFAENGNNSLVKGSDSALASFIGKDFGAGFFHSNPVATQGLSEDFKAQTERYYKLTGDINTAQKTAWADLKRVYGPSKVNGVSVIMPFPPERFGVTPEAVRAEMTAFLAEHPQANGAKPEDVILVPDSLTLRNVVSALDGQPQRPSFKAMVGADLLHDKNGVPQRFMLPSGEETTAKLRAQQDAENAARIEAAKKQREFNQQYDANRVQDYSRGAP